MTQTCEQILLTDLVTVLKQYLTVKFLNFLPIFFLNFNITPHQS